MPASAPPWPPALAGTPATAVIDRAIARERLGHSLLLQGDSLDTLVAVAFAIAGRLLPGPPPEKHPDCFALRPAGKMRLITADATRELIAKVQVSATLAARKVAIVHEADRMNSQAANIFLKTLEEPPAHTTILLLTTHPYALLPTIRSRCLHFRFPTDASVEKFTEAENWPAWLQDYRAWIGRLAAGGTDKRTVADHIFSIYGLVARFKVILDRAAAAAWEKTKEALPPELEEDEQTAIEAGLAKGIRARFFAEIEEATLASALPRLAADDAPARRAFTAAIDKLEHNAGLLNLNLNESAALEDFLLASLRLWARRS